MYKIKHNLSPNAFKNNFNKIDHKYPTRHSMHSFHRPKTISKATSFSILNRGPYLWNRIHGCFKDELKSAHPLEKPFAFLRHNGFRVAKYNTLAIDLFIND